jgi:putative nucleotidyltransferase with HDIG domain
VRKCAVAVEQMATSGLLEVIFPELSATRRVTANAFHHLGLFEHSIEHSIETVPQLESRLEEVEEWVLADAEKELSFGVSRLAATKLACLLHDIGKPETWAITPEGRHTFYGHDKLGAKMCQEVGKRMKWARPVEKLIVDLVQWHLRPGALFHQGPPTDKAVRRFYRSVQDELPELMLLAFGDFGATRGPGLIGENRAELEKSLVGLLDGYLAYKEESSRRQKLLNGSDVMQLLSIASGPVVGEMLAALEEAQEFKEVGDRSEAEAFVTALFREKYRK